MSKRKESTTGSGRMHRKSAKGTDEKGNFDAKTKYTKSRNT